MEGREREFDCMCSMLHRARSFLLASLDSIISTMRVARLTPLSSDERINMLCCLLACQSSKLMVVRGKCMSLKTAFPSRERSKVFSTVSQGVL